MTDTSLYGLGLNTFNGTIWLGQAPTHGVWDANIQMFSFEPTENAETPDAQGMDVVVETLQKTLSMLPKARQPVGKGHVVRPAMRVACPECRGEKLAVPVQVNLTSEGVFEAWFGKGNCRCARGYVGTKAKVKNLGMYDYTDLVQNRSEYGAMLLETIAENRS